VGKQPFQLPFPCRLIQIRNWNQNLLSNLFKMRAWELISQLIPLSSFTCSHNQSIIHFPSFSAYRVINLYTSICCIFLSAYLGDEQLSIVAGGQNVSKPTNCSKKPRTKPQILLAIPAYRLRYLVFAQRVDIPR
jgi:hypothetical protein